MPPSPASSRVLALLTASGSATFSQILSELGMRPRTARYAIRCLKKKGKIEGSPSLKDTRKMVYRKKE